MEGMKVTVLGVEYPSYQTMAAWRIFKKETGKEVSEMRPGDISDMIVFIWACTVSACRREGKTFDLSLDDFCDWLTPEDVMAWNAAQSGDTEGDDDGSKKKDPSQS